MSTHIGIFGAGSIGCYVGGRLAAGGQKVTFVGRERFQKAARENGLTLTHFDLPPITAQDVDFQTEPSKLSDCDIIIVTVKSTGSQAAGETMRGHLKTGAILVSLQNGIGNQDVISDSLPGFKVYAGMIPSNVVTLGNGKFHMGSGGIIQMEDTPQLRVLCETMKACGIEAKVSTDMASVQWGKLLLNLNNALNCLSGKPLKAQLRDKAYRKVFADCIEETLGILKAANIKPTPIGGVTSEKMVKFLRLPNFLYGPVMARSFTIDETARSSMWEDLMQGRPTEIEFINGAIIRLAERHGLDAPINRKICALVHAAFDAGRSPELSGKALREQIRQAR